jgi:tRNA(fMet)-specific endonuclease VapC
MPLLLDTVIASLLHPRKRNSSRRLLYEPHLTGEILALSFQTVAELYQWAEQNKWGVSARSTLDQFIARFVRVPHDDETNRAWARVMTHARAIGRRLDAADAWIAATALRHSLPLVTDDADLASLKVQGLTIIHHAAE